MPRNGERVTCINHQLQEMEPLDGFNALTQLTKEGQKFTFNPTSGVPIKAYLCRRCGYIEIYHAIAIDEWNSL